MRIVVVVVGVFVLGCGGALPMPIEPPSVVPEPAQHEEADDGTPSADEVVADAEPVEEGDPTPEWVTEAVAQATDWEVMPGTTSEENPERTLELRAFFLAHPEYEDPDERQKLADMACSLGTEEAHKRLNNPKAAQPMVVHVDSASWSLVISHSSYWCTSDDWSYFTNEVDEAVAAKGIQTAYANAEVSQVVVKSGETELARIPMDGQGYVFARAGQPTSEMEHDMPEGVIQGAMEYFGK
jgi:hypothetical protein